MPVYKGWKGQIYLGGFSTLVGYAESVSVSITRNTEAVRCIGKQNPDQTSKGDLEVTGSMRRAWLDNQMLSYIFEKSAAVDVKDLANFDLYLYPGGKTPAGSPCMYLFDCKITDGTFDMAQDDIAGEDLSFLAEDWQLYQTS
jgi:hypothetical protein